MSYLKFWVSPSPFFILWFVATAVVVVFAYSVYAHGMSPYWMMLPLGLFMLMSMDTFNRKHAIRRNFPLVGRLRYLFESFRPEFRQYFFESELDGKPFNRRQRSIVYQRAKDVKQTTSFGMQDDPQRVGYEWAAHSVYPKKANPDKFRVWIGNYQSAQPYLASIVNIGAMSYGALSKTAITALNNGARLGDFAHNTGEGGISPYHLQGGDLIWQIGTGYFGCRDANGRFDESLFVKNAKEPKVKMIELKLSQGAKPGHGGLLPAQKNTPEIAAIRSIEPYTTVHSPAAHSAFSNATELIQFIGKLRVLSRGKPVGFKMCIGRKWEFIEIVQAIKETGIMPDFISIDGAEGGTGAAPLEFIEHMGMALSDALAFASKTLDDYDLKPHVKLIASGKIITAFDIAKHLALGADAVYMSRGMMFALGCIQALQCDSGKCPVGIATQNRWLYNGIDVTDKGNRVASFHNNTMKALADFIGAIGFEHPYQLTPLVFFKRTAPNTTESFALIYSKRVARAVPTF